MLPFDILAANDHVYSFEPACRLPRHKRFSEGCARNDWEQALVHVQENDASAALPAVYAIPDFKLVLWYCAAHALLSKRDHLLHAERIEDWYMLLDGCAALDIFDNSHFSSYTLGRLRTLYGIEWLHARAMRYTPLQHVWFAGHYWSTRWSASTPPKEKHTNPETHNIERWSFYANLWHIQHWVCEAKTSLYSYSTYTSEVVSCASIQKALDRTLLLGPNMCTQAWDAIPLNQRARHLLDWTLAEPSHDHQVLPYLCHTLAVDIDDLSMRLDLARTLASSGTTVLQSLSNRVEQWALPQD